MGRIIISYDKILCEVKEKEVRIAVIRETVEGGDSLIPIDYVVKSLICLEREQNGCRFYGESICSLRQKYNNN